MSLARRIARNRRAETDLYAGLAKFEVDARSDTDPERSKERMRILGKVREFALHVKETDLDKAWAYLCECRKEYDPKKDGLSEAMSWVDDWRALDAIAGGPELSIWVALCAPCRQKAGVLERTEECTKGHMGERPCESCGALFIGQCIARADYEAKRA